MLASVLAAPALLRSGLPTRSRRVARWLRQLRDGLASVRSGLAVFRSPRLGAQAACAQLAAWGLQWLACYVLLVALGLDHRAGIGAAAAVLFAVNVTAVLPATPSNLGVFQAACVAVLHGAYGVGSADALGYGIVLQAVEIATAVAMGTPALLREGLSWKDVRLRAMHAAPVDLEPLPVAAEADSRPSRALPGVRRPSRSSLTTPGCGQTTTRPGIRADRGAEPQSLSSIDLTGTAVTRANSNVAVCPAVAVEQLSVGVVVSASDRATEKLSVCVAAATGKKNFSDSDAGPAERVQEPVTLAVDGRSKAMTAVTHQVPGGRWLGTTATVSAGALVTVPPPSLETLMSGSSGAPWGPAAPAAPTAPAAPAGPAGPMGPAAPRSRLTAPCASLAYVTERSRSWRVPTLLPGSTTAA